MCLSADSTRQNRDNHARQDTDAVQNTGAGSLFVSPELVQAGLAVPYEQGAAGVVIYVEQEDVTQPAALAKQLATVTGPAGQALLAHVQACAAHCSGHGRCMPLGSQQCECYKGFTGPKCSVHS